MGQTWEDINMLSMNCWECVPPYLGGTRAYWGPISVLFVRNGGPEPKVEPSRSPVCARAAETWAASLHVTYSRRRPAFAPCNPPLQ